jgi:diguanylate cyclase (GGDEF)-like protein
MQVSGDVEEPRPARSIAPRRWRLWSLSRPVLVYVLTVDVAALAVVATTVGVVDVTNTHWAWFGLLALAAVTHLEAAQGIERVREVTAEGAPHTHLQSVWLFAGILLLPPPLLAALIVISYTHSWVRVYRGRALVYRKVFSAASVVLGCAAAVTALRAILPDPDAPFAGQLDGPIGLVAVVAAGLLYRLINYSLVVGAIIATNPDKPARAALGNGSDQLSIAAAIGLATAIAMIMPSRPWLTPLLIVTVLALHMGLLLPQFRAASRTDSKTRLLDPTFWTQLAGNELDRARRLGGTLGIMLLDLDRFKQINDTYGHIAGDAVLRAAADAIRHSVRGYDPICRYGGEEFGVILPGLSAEGVATTAERIRRSVSELSVTTVDLTGSVRTICGLTASVGAAVYPDHGCDASSLLLAADAALYEAKASGRNRTRIALRLAELPAARQPVE